MCPDWTVVTKPNMRPTPSSVSSSFFSSLFSSSAVHLRKAAFFSPFLLFHGLSSLSIHQGPSSQRHTPLIFWDSHPDQTDQAPQSSPSEPSPPFRDLRKRSVNFHLLPEITWRKILYLLVFTAWFMSTLMVSVSSAIMVTFLGLGRFHSIIL